MQLQNGRPTDTTGRLDKEIRTYDFLDKLGIEYQRIDHEAAFTMEICEEIDKTLGATICKNLFLCNRQKTDFYLHSSGASLSSLHANSYTSGAGFPCSTIGAQMILSKYP